MTPTMSSDDSISNLPACNHEHLQQLRSTHLSSNLTLSHTPTLLHITHANDQYMYTCDGTQYLDAYNNVAHVGHSNAYVATQAAKQLTLVNTNTRYLDHHLVNYTQQLTAQLPDELSVVYLVNSGSEANELALRLARAATSTTATEFITVDSCYFGNTHQLIQLSPYKFNGRGGGGQVAHVHVAELPDVYRGRYRGVTTAGEQYADSVKLLLDHIHGTNKHVCAFMCESLLSCGGQLVLPSKYLSTVYKYVRAAGGVCIADEVQTGLGRCGAFTCFQTYNDPDCVPDIVTFGKPLGNGYPLGAVVTTRRIADAFASTGMEWFNTCGGSTLACVVGLAVLNELNSKQFMQHAVHVGEYFMDKLKQMQGEFACIGDVRGLGLMIGIEIVDDDTFNTNGHRAHTSAVPPPNGSLAAYCVAYMLQHHRILCGTDGPHHNVIKFKPPMCFSTDNADTVVHALRCALTNHKPIANHKSDNHAS